LRSVRLRRALLDHRQGHGCREVRHDRGLERRGGAGDDLGERRVPQFLVEDLDLDVAGVARGLDG
jgi:hypothetical protein